MDVEPKIRYYEGTIKQDALGENKQKVFTF